MRTDTPVLVASSTETAVLQGVMGVLRSLGPLGVPVHLVHPRRRTPMARSRYAASHHQLRLDPADAQAYVRALLDVGARIGGQPVLIGTDDLVAGVLCEHAEDLARTFRLRVPRPELACALSDKWQLAELCREHGVATPRSALVTSCDQSLQFAETVGWPVVVKCRFPEGVAARGASVVLAHSPAELRAAITCAGDVLADSVLQEHIPGEADSVWMFNGYFDGRSQCAHAFTGRKLRQCRPDTGYTSLGVCAPNADVEVQVRRLLTALGYTGIVDLGMRLDARTGTYHLLDVNPRLGATFRLFVGDDGTDVVRALYGDLTGQPLPPATTVSGRTWLSEPHDAYASLLYARARRLHLRDWVRSCREVDETAWWDPHDPLPFASMLGGVLTQAWRDRRSLRRETAQVVAVPRSVDVVRHFGASVEAWDEVYARHDVDAQTYRRRLALTLDWLDELALPPGSRVLDVGAGAGHLATALAARGLRVVAVDASAEMLARAVSRGPSGSTVSATRADALALPFRAGTFAVVVALGVIPWVTDPDGLLREMHRVCVTPGHVLLSSDSRHRLHWMLDPRYNPGLRPARQAARRGAQRLGIRLGEPMPSATLHTPPEVHMMLRRAGSVPVKDASLGFGPFTFLGMPLLPPAPGNRVSLRLESLATPEHARLRGLACQHLVLARTGPTGDAYERRAL